MRGQILLNKKTPAGRICVSTPKGNRTPVLALRGLCPGPLDDRGGQTEILARATPSINQAFLLDIGRGR